MPPASRKDQDALHIVHEGLGLGEVRRAGAVLDDEQRRVAGLADDAARAAGDFGHHVRPEALHDLVERAVDGCERRQMLDQAGRGARRPRGICTGWPSRNTGRDERLPSLSVNGS